MKTLILGAALAAALASPGEAGTLDAVFKASCHRDFLRRADYLACLKGTPGYMPGTVIDNADLAAIAKTGVIVAAGNDYETEGWLCPNNHPFPVSVVSLIKDGNRWSAIGTGKAGRPIKLRCLSNE